MWEEIQKFSDDPLTVCKSCEKEGGVHKILPPQMNFVLTGDGDTYRNNRRPKKGAFYTDSRGRNVMFPDGD